MPKAAPMPRLTSRQGDPQIAANPEHDDRIGGAVLGVRSDRWTKGEHGSE
jgi:hypothetical protein